MRSSYYSACRREKFFPFAAQDATVSEEVSAKPLSSDSAFLSHVEMSVPQGVEVSLPERAVAALRQVLIADGLSAVSAKPTDGGQILYFRRNYCSYSYAFSRKASGLYLVSTTMK